MENTSFIGPFFSSPKLRREVHPDFSLYVELMEVFQRILPGTTIRAAMYMWNHDTAILRKSLRDKWNHEYGHPSNLTEVFVERAKECDAELIFDNYNQKMHPKCMEYLATCSKITVDTRENVSDPEFRRQLAKKKKLADTGYMHDKFFLFSELRGIGKYVILQTTANINITQTHQFNNMILMYGNESVYREYAEHWEMLKYNILKRQANEKVPRTLYSNPLDRTKPCAVYFMPRKKCPVESELNEILKSGRGKNIQIDICMAYMTRPKFRETLYSLTRIGCKVRVLLSQEIQNTNTERFLDSVRMTYKVIRNAVYNKEFFMVGQEKALRDNWKGRMHHKFVLIKTNKDHITWTGSYNLTHPGVHLNDEAVLRINDPNVYHGYLTEFEVLWGGKKPKNKNTIKLF